MRIDQKHSGGDKYLFCTLHEKYTKSSHGRSIVVNPILEEIKKKVLKNLGNEGGKKLKVLLSYPKTDQISQDNNHKIMHS